MSREAVLIHMWNVVYIQLVRSSTYIVLNFFHDCANVSIAGKFFYCLQFKQIQVILSRNSSLKSKSNLVLDIEIEIKMVWILVSFTFIISFRMLVINFSVWALSAYNGSIERVF